MANLRAAPPRPSKSRIAPSYPRVLAAFAIVLAGCGGVVENENRSKSTPETPNPAGGLAVEFDSGQPDVQQPDTTPPPPDPAGDIAYPYEDSGPPDTGTPDTGKVDTGSPDTEPPFGGGAPYPYEDGGAPEPGEDGGAAPTPEEGS
ncbi:MAG: hypothetical protein HYV09_30800 [Deltaproteobacteria bacterium]|nr:hypothetical protein [Deltaproteobacteria bacterium]